MKKYDLSLKDYKKSLELDSLFYQGYIAIGKQYAETSEVENAVKFLNRAIQVDTNLCIAYFELSKIYYSINDFNKSKFYSETAQNKDTTLSGALYYQSLAELNLGEVEKSKNDFYKFIHLNCKYKNLNNNNVLDDLDKTIAENKKALELKEILINNPCSE